VKAAHESTARTAAQGPAAQADLAGTIDAAPAAAGTGLPPDASWGSLTIRSKLGEGAFGEVYLAHDASLDRDVALKLLRAQAGGERPDLKRFLSEARRLARVRHPNVLVVHGVDTRDGRVGIWTDLVRGKTLEEYLANAGTLGAREAALIGVDLCQALAAVHKAGLLHRDVKPSNVMREEGGRIVLMDFGSGGDLPPGGGITRSDHAYGTPLCMAPEQLRGEVAGPSTDVYALGVLLYRAVSSAYPIEASDFIHLHEKHRLGERIPLRDRRPDLPSGFVQVVDRALEPRPEDRFASAGAMEKALLATLGTDAPAAAAAGGTPARGRLALLLGVGAGIAIFAVSLFLIVRSSRVDRTGQASTGTASTATTGQAPRTEAPPAAPPTPTGALMANAVLYRDADGASQRLAPGGRVEPGDDLYMSVESAESMFVYVLNEDDRGSIFILFPVPGLTPENPLPPGAAHRLPGRLGGEPVNWEVTSAGGEERIMVLASREPLANLETDLAGFPRAVTGAPIQYGELSQTAVSSLRGIGGFSTGAQAGVVEPKRLTEVLGQLSGDAPERSGLWVWQIGLENPPK
jgi:serine/threonine-protein kinase